MSKAHVSSDVQLANRPVVIDSPYTAHFSFNNSLVSQGYDMYPLVDPTSRAISGAANAVEGTDQKFSSTGLVVPGKFGNGLGCNEDTTNLAAGVNLGFRDGDRWVSTISYPTGLPVTPIWKVWKRNSTNTYWGSFSSFIATNPSPYNRTFTVSFWYYLEPGYDGTVSAGFYGAPNSGDSTYNTISTTLESNFSTAIKGQWVFGYSVMKITTNAYSYNYFPGCSGGTIADGKHMYVANFQLEEHPYYTSFINGSRSQLNLTYPNYPVRTASLWVKSTSSKTVDGVNTPRTILRQVDNSDTYPQWSLYAANTNTSDTLPGTATPVPDGSAVLKVKWKTDGVNVTSYLCTVSTINILDGDWHHINCEFGIDSRCRIWVDDKYGDTVVIPETNYTFNGLLRVGYDSTSEQAGNFLIDDLRLDNKNYSYEDMRKRYIAGVEYYNPFDYGSTCVT